MKTKLMLFVAIGVASFLLPSCSCPSDPTIDHHFTAYQLGYLAGIQGKRMTFEDAEGYHYFIKVEPSNLVASSYTEHSRKGGQFSCKPVTPTHITYSSSMALQSDIPNFKWGRINFSRDEDDFATVNFTSLDSTQTGFSGTLETLPE